MASWQGSTLAFVTGATLAGLAAFVLADSGVRVRPVENDYGSQGISGEALRGVRFYRPALHVWILKATPPKSGMRTIVETSERNPDGSPAGSVKKTTNREQKRARYSVRFTMLPDLSQEYVVQPPEGLAASSFSAELSEGWNLTSINSKSQGAAAAASQMTKAVASVGSMAGTSLAAQEDFRGPGLYEMDFAEDRWKLGDLVLPIDASE